MKAVVQSEGSSRRRLTGSASAQRTKSSAGTSQNAQLHAVRAKKRDRSEKTIDSNKCPRLDQVDRSVVDIRSLVGKSGGLCNLACVDRLLYIMQHDCTNDSRKPIDEMIRKTMLVNIISATEQLDCLSQFVKLGGLSLLDKWLQEAHQGKSGGTESKIDGENALEDLLLTLLYALERLPVDLPALQACSVGKSVNNLRSHRHLEIQKRARKLVDMWKKRVDAEMKHSDELYCGENKPMQLPTKQQLPTEQNLKEAVSFDDALKHSVFSVKSASQNPNSPEVVAPGESSCTGTGKFTSIALLCSPVVCEAQVTAPSSSLSDKPCNNSSQSTDLGSPWSNATSKSSNNTGLSVDDGKGELPVSLNRKVETLECRSYLRPGKGGAEACPAAGIGKAALLCNRNVALEKPNQTGSPFNDGASAGGRVESYAYLTSLQGRIPDDGQSSLLATSGSSISEMHSLSSGSSSLGMSDNHVHVECGDVTANRTMDVGGLAVSAGRETQKRSAIVDKDHDFPLPNPIDLIERSRRHNTCNGKESTLPTGQTGNTNENGDDVQSVAQVTSAFSNEDFCKNASSSFKLATVGINLLASVAAIECSKIDAKASSSLSDKKSFLWRVANASQENILSTKTRPDKHRNKLRSKQLTIQTEASGIFAEREHFDRNSSTISSPSDAETETEGDNFFGESDKVHVKHSDGPVSAPEAPTAIHAASDRKSPVLDSIQQTLSLVKASLKQSLVFDGADSEEVCNIQGTTQRGDDDWTRKPALGGEAMGESSISGVAELDAPREEEKDAGIHMTQQAWRSGKRELESTSSFFADDALEVARQVAIEVEQEMVNNQRRSLKRENSNSTQSCGTFQGENSACIVESPLKFSTRAEMEKFCRLPPSGRNSTAPSGSIIACWNLNNMLDTQDEYANCERVGLAKTASYNTILESAHVRPTNLGMQPNVNVSSPAIPEQASSSVLGKNEMPTYITDPPTQDLKQASCSTEAGDMSTCGQTVAVLRAQNTIIQRNTRLERPDFDLNKGHGCEEGLVQESLPSFPVPSFKPLSTGPVAPIAIVAAVKGPFVPPVIPFRPTGGFGWKGSAATSAFRPAQPRRNAEKQNDTVQTMVVEHCSEAKIVKPLLKIDLNVAADTSLDDADAMGTADLPLKPSLQSLSLPSSQSSTLQARSGISEIKCVRPIWDLNCVDEGEEGGILLASEIKDGVPNSTKKIKSRILDFDLNCGPISQDNDQLQPSSGFEKCSVPSSSGIRMAADVSNADSLAGCRNFATGPVLTSGVPQVPAAPCPQCLPNAGPNETPFHYDILRQGDGFTSSGFICPRFPPVAYSYNGFPFEYSPASFHSLSTPFMDLCEARTLPSFLPPRGSTEAVIPSQIRAPYIMGMLDAMGPNGGSVVGRPNLDLNAGPDFGDADAKAENRRKQLSAMTSFGDQSRLVYQLDVTNNSKRKEPEEGWGMQTAGFRKHMWQ